MNEVKRNFDILDYALKNHPLEDCLAAKENGQWVKYSTQKVKEMVDQLSYGFIKLGIQKGDKIATITNNRPEWNITNIALAQVGAIICPIYPTISEEDYKYIFNDAQIKYAILSDDELFKKIEAVKPSVPSLLDVYSYNNISGCKNWKELVQLGIDNPSTEELESRKSVQKEDDLVTIIYTSGTTGNPKGVMLSHLNLVSNAKAGIPRLPLDKGDRALSFLPLCHVFERTVLNVYLLGGISIYYAESIETIGDNIKEIKPHIFTAVPRLIEKVYDKIIAGGGQKSGLIKKLFFWAVKKANAYEIGSSRNWLANKLVYSKIRAGLGGNVKCIVSGSAALQTRLQKFFWGVGLPILEGYGLTETSPIISVNTLLPGGTRLGTVGKVIEDVTVKIAEDGEILVQGPNVMMGYYNMPEKTAEDIKDGWFHTGDIGVLEGGFLKITDRKKQMFKTSGGKYVAPGPIENTMKASLFIEQIMVIGEGKKHPAALVVPSFEYIKNWAKEQGHNCSTNQEICQNEAVLNAIWEDINLHNKSFGKVEQIKKIELCDQDWTIDGGELTPTLKLKRKPILEKYGHLVDKIYTD